MPLDLEVDMAPCAEIVSGRLVLQHTASTGRQGGGRQAGGELSNSCILPDTEAGFFTRPLFKKELDEV